MKQLSLLEGKFHCCGALCDKKQAQERIDRMQRIIDITHEFFTWEHFPEDKFEDMLKELAELSSD